jgi:molybdate transport system permease protein
MSGEPGCEPGGAPTAGGDGAKGDASDAGTPHRAPAAGTAGAATDPRVRSDLPFYICLGLLGGSYLLLILVTLFADGLYLVLEDELGSISRVSMSREVQYAARLSVVSSTVTTILALWVAVPIGYLMSRHRFRGKALVDAILDIPIVLPPLVIGVSLLILFKTIPIVAHAISSATGGAIEFPSRALTELFVYAVPGVILSQFMVAAAFAVRTLRAAFDDIPLRKEQVALTLGCTRAQAFWRVVMPEARSGLLAAATVTWARALGEFGPILVFAGATPMRTQVLPTSVYLQLSVGDLAGSVAISLGMVLLAIVVLVVVRTCAQRDITGRIVR